MSEFSFPRSFFIFLSLGLFLFSVASQAERVLPNTIQLDLDSGVAPKYPNFAHLANIPEQEIRRKVANYILNITSPQQNMFTIAAAQYGNGVVSVNRNTLDNTLDINEILRIENEVENETDVRGNPYICNAQNSGLYRMDYLAAFLSDAESYYRVANLPTTFQQLATNLNLDANNPPGDVGVDNNNRNKIIVPHSSIVINREERVLYFEPLNRGGTFYGSTDFPSVRQASEEVFGKPETRPLDFSGKAGEFIFSLRNGLHAYYLAAANGARQTAAPADVVQNQQLLGTNTPSAHNNPQIRPPFDCMRCHNGGLRGGNSAFEIGSFLQESLTRGLVSQNTVNNARGRYITSQTYAARRVTDNQAYLEAINRADAYLPLVPPVAGQPLPPSIPIMSDMAAEYWKPLTMAQVARELRVNVDTFRTSVANVANVNLRNKLNIKATTNLNNFSVSRRTFENIFCDLRQLVQ